MPSATESGLAQPPECPTRPGSRFPRLLSRVARNAAAVTTALLVVALVPALRAARLPLRFNWPVLLGAWVGLIFQSLFLACILYGIAGPFESTLKPFLRRYWNDKRRLLLLLPLVVELFWLEGAFPGAVLVVTVLAVVELLERTRRQPGAFLTAVEAVMLPAAYLFVGLVVTFALNDLIVTRRFYGAYDALFNRADTWILGGATVSELAHQAARMLPRQTFTLLEIIYWGMFSQIGAGIIFTGLQFGKGRAYQLVGTILTGYFLALVCFYLWPSHGPYYTCPGHFSSLPDKLSVYAAQQTLLLRAQALWQGRGVDSIGTDYFIAFPCMHIAQPLIVMWFLRGWRRVVLALLLLDVLLTVSILLLEWHYLVDLPGGVAIAALAIASVGREPVSGGAGDPANPSRGECSRPMTSARQSA